LTEEERQELLDRLKTADVLLHRAIRGLEAIIDGPRVPPKPKPWWRFWR